MTTGTSVSEKHSQRCHQEATRDVIFLFQTRGLVWTGNLPSGFIFDSDADDVYREEDVEREHPVSLAEIIKEHGSEYGIATWRTIGVWLDRAEAEAWGESQRHNYGEKYDEQKIQNRCWQVYGVPAEGELAELIRCVAP